MEKGFLACGMLLGMPCTELLETESLHVLEACAEHKEKGEKHLNGWGI